MAGRRTKEKHPVNHSWFVDYDTVVIWESDRPVIIVRHEKCEYCPTVLVTKLHVPSWDRLSRYYRYKKGVIIERMSKSDFRRQEFLKSTALPAKIRRML